MKKYMKIWQDFAIEERLLCWDKENRAEELNSRLVLPDLFEGFRSYTHDNKSHVKICAIQFLNIALSSNYFV